MVHRRALMNYAEMAPLWQRERDILETDMMISLEEAWRGGMMKNLSKQCGLFVKTGIEKNASKAMEMKSSGAESQASRSAVVQIVLETGKRPFRIPIIVSVSSFYSPPYPQD